MIDALWPGPPGSVVRGDWTAPPFAHESWDVVLCDGGLHLLSYPGGQTLLARAIRAVLRPGGRFVTRLFAPPRRRERPEEVIADLRAGRVANVNLLKLRLGMALQEDPASGVALARVWEAVAANGDVARVGRSLGWSAAHLATLNSYRDCADRYHFVTLDEAAGSFREAGWRLQTVGHGTYELAERCPVVTFVPAD